MSNIHDAQGNIVWEDWWEKFTTIYDAMNKLDPCLQHGQSVVSFSNFSNKYYCEM